MARNKLAIYLDYGRKGSGKSLSMAKTVLDLFEEYARTEKKYPELKRRFLFSNQKLSPEIEAKELHTHLYYWSSAHQLRYCPREDCWKIPEAKKEKDNPQGLHPVHDCDIIWDEIGKDLPAGSWTETPKWMKQIFSHLRKRGNRCYANTRVYDDIDISFRRQLDQAHEIKKLIGSGDITATRPQPKFVWGVIMSRKFDPVLIEHERDPQKREEKATEAGTLGFPKFIFITRRLVDAYDTRAEVPPYKPDTLEHGERWCENDMCPKHGKLNPKAKPVLTHRVI